MGSACAAFTSRRPRKPRAPPRSGWVRPEGCAWAVVTAAAVCLLNVPLPSLRRALSQHAQQSARVSPVGAALPAAAVPARARQTARSHRLVTRHFCAVSRPRPLARGSHKRSCGEGAGTHPLAAGRARLQRPEGGHVPVVDTDGDAARYGHSTSLRHDACLPKELVSPPVDHDPSLAGGSTASAVPGAWRG